MVPAFSVPKATRQQKIPSIPGPGSYDGEKTRNIKANDPQFSFSRQSRAQMSTLTPGPGSYQSYALDKGQKYSILGRHNQPTHKYNIGPGQYQPLKQALQPRSPSFSILGKKEQTIRQTPGPNHYISKSFIDSSHGHDFGRGSRTKVMLFKTPGPGEYSYEQASIKYKAKQQPQYGFGLKISTKKQDTPGPGEYHPKREVFSKIGGIASHHLQSAFLSPLTPGPGAYEIRLNTQQNNPKWSLPRQKRVDIIKKNTVGPGHYNDEKSFQVAVQKSPSYGFGSLQKLKVNTPKMPGPAQYTSNYQFSRKSIKIGHKKPNNYDNKIPGPGVFIDLYKAYQSAKYDGIKWLNGKGSYSLGKQKKMVSREKLVPGPGAYATTSPMQTKGKKADFSKQQRMRPTKDSSPGPASYLIKPTFADVPKYLL